MNTREARKLWVERLRSGEVEQTRGRLARGDKRCCLGVACDVYIEHADDGLERVEDDNGLIYYQAGGNEWTHHLPHQVADWMGLSRADGGYRESWGGEFTLAGRNDGGDTFDEIADLIAAEPDGLVADDDAN